MFLPPCNAGPPAFAVETLTGSMTYIVAEAASDDLYYMTKTPSVIHSMTNVSNSQMQDVRINSDANLGVLETRNRGDPLSLSRLYAQ